MINLPRENSLKSLIFAGESSSEELLNRYSHLNIQVINAYGPTESTVCSSFNTYQYNGASNIGKSLGNIKQYVLDATLKPVPVSIVGELYIGGAGLARGYLHRSELTAERFIENPFVSEQDKAEGKNLRLYKTED